MQNLNDVISSVSIEQPEMTYEAGRIYRKGLDYGKFAKQSFPQKFKRYSKSLREMYTKEEVEEAATWIDDERDNLLTFLGSQTLATRYQLHDGDGTLIETAQERFLATAMYLARGDMQLARQAYDALSTLQMTVATPTLANSGKDYGQLSSCFIVTPEDSLEGIYHSVTEAARLSKGGGGIGVYAGYIRSRGSSIAGHEGKSSGTIPFLKLFDATAVAVDQLGTRKGAIAVYQDVWHPDILAFLDLRLNNGDESNRAHNLHLGVSLPDAFMKAVEADEDWYLIDPYDFQKAYGYHLAEMWGTAWEYAYRTAVDAGNYNRVVKAKDIWRAILRSQLETGYPYMFYRDTVNAANPNKHMGTILSSNLCSEILQNQSPDQEVYRTMSVHGEIREIYQSGDTVTCNLSSLALPNIIRNSLVSGKLHPEDEKRLAETIELQVTLLDNVIDLNDNLPSRSAQRTNERYRAVGAGVSGWHQLLAQQGIDWESDEATQFSDYLWETIAYYTIKASARLAKLRGAYPLFKGSDWQTGAYFEKRGYRGEKWDALKAEVAKGIRNGYLMAVAPTGSTSLISDTTAGLDAVTDIYYTEEKKDMRVPVVVPRLDSETYPYYKPAYLIDQSFTIQQAAARQRHIDQGQSLNLYLNGDAETQGGGKKAVKLSRWHLEGWKAGLKTTYYVRSRTVMAESCVWCE